MAQNIAAHLVPGQDRLEQWFLDLGRDGLDDSQLWDCCQNAVEDVSVYLGKGPMLRLCRRVAAQAMRSPSLPPYIKCR